MSLQSTPSHVGLNANLSSLPPSGPPISPASRGYWRPDHWLWPVKDAGVYWTRNNHLDFSVRSNGGTGSQHVKAGRDKTLPRSFFTCQERVVKLKPPESVSRVIKPTVNMPIRDTDNSTSGMFTCLGCFHVISQAHAKADSPGPRTG